MNSLFLVTYDDIHWDEHDAGVISAASYVEALQIASTELANRRSPTVRKIANHTNEPTGLVIGSFNAG